MSEKVREEAYRIACDQRDDEHDRAELAIASVERMREALEKAADKVARQAECLERYAEQSGFKEKPVPSVFHLQASHFKDIAREMTASLSSPVTACSHRYDTVPAADGEPEITACEQCGHVLNPVSGTGWEEYDAQLLAWLNACKPNPEHFSSDHAAGVISGFEIIIAQVEQGFHRLPAPPAALTESASTPEGERP